MKTAIKFLIKTVERGLLDHLEENRWLKVRSQSFRKIAKEHDLNESFFWEILQNIEDSARDFGKPTKVTFKLTTNTFEVSYLGKPFQQADIRSIGTGDSTKDENKMAVGEKGKGFKSGFILTDDLSIQSAGDHFRYNKASFLEKMKNEIEILKTHPDSEKLLGVIQHLWMGIPEYKQVKDISNEEYNIRITYLLKEEKIEFFKNCLSSLTEEQFCFFDYITDINILKDEDKEIPIKILAQKKKFKPIYEDTVHLDLDNERLIKLAKESDKEKYKDSLVSIKIYKSKDEEGINYPFFRLREIKGFDFRFPFIVSSNFILNDNRSDLDYQNHYEEYLESYWNEALLKSIAEITINELCRKKDISGLLLIAKNGSSNKSAVNVFKRFLKEAFVNLDPQIFKVHEMTDSTVKHVGLRNALIDKSGIIGLFDTSRRRNSNPIFNEDASDLVSLRDFYLDIKKSKDLHVIEEKHIKSYLIHSNPLSKSEKSNLIEYFENHTDPNLFLLIEDFFLVRIKGSALYPSEFLHLDFEYDPNLLPSFQNVTCFSFRDDFKEKGFKKRLLEIIPEKDRILTISSYSELILKTSQTARFSFIEKLKTLNLSQLPELEDEAYSKLEFLKNILIIDNGIQITEEEKSILGNVFYDSDLKGRLKDYLTSNSFTRDHVSLIDELVRRLKKKEAQKVQNLVNDLIIKLINNVPAENLNLPKDLIQFPQGDRRFNPSKDWFLPEGDYSTILTRIWKTKNPSDKTLILTGSLKSNSIFKKLSYTYKTEEAYDAVFDLLLKSITNATLDESIESWKEAVHLLANKEVSKPKLESLKDKLLETEVFNSAELPERNKLRHLFLNTAKTKIDIKNFHVNKAYGEEVIQFIEDTGLLAESLNDFLKIEEVQLLSSPKKLLLNGLTFKDWEYFWKEVRLPKNLFTDALTKALRKIECIPTEDGLRFIESCIDIINSNPEDFEGVLRLFPELVQKSSIQIKQNLLGQDIGFFDLEATYKEIKTLDSTDIEEIIKNSPTINVITENGDVKKASDCWFLNRQNISSFDQDLQFISPSSIVEISNLFSSNKKFWSKVVNTLGDRILEDKSAVIKTSLKPDIDEMGMRLYLYESTKVSSIEFSINDLKLEWNEKSLFWFKSETHLNLFIKKNYDYPKEILRKVEELLKTFKFGIETETLLQKIASSISKSPVTALESSTPYGRSSSKFNSSYSKPAFHLKQNEIQGKESIGEPSLVENSFHKITKAIKSQLSSEKLIFSTDHIAQFKSYLNSIPRDAQGTLYISSGWAKGSGFRDILSELVMKLDENADMEVKLFFELQDLDGNSNSIGAQKIVNEILENKSFGDRLQIVNHPMIHAKAVLFVSPTHPSQQFLVIGSFNWLSNTGDNSIELSLKTNNDKIIGDARKFFDIIEQFKQKNGIDIPE